MKQYVIYFFIILMIGQDVSLYGRETIATNVTHTQDGFGAQIRRLIAAVFYAEM